MARRGVRLRAVKLLHTVVWAFFASCVLAIAPLAWVHRFDLALLCIGLVAIEVMVLLLNAWRCPLTDVAARYTDDRQDNFDIYLPLWLARYNKEVFGTLFTIGVLVTLTLWLRR